MTWTLVQKSAAVAVTSGGTTVTGTLPGGSSAGNLLVAVLSDSDGHASWTLPAGWQRAQHAANYGNSGADIWYLPPGSNPGGISSVLCASSRSADLKAALAEFHTDLAAAVVSLGATGTGLAGAVTSCPVTAGTVPGAGDLLIGCWHQRFTAAAAVTWTDPAGMTLLADTTGSATHQIYSAYQLAAPGGTQAETPASSVASDNTTAWAGCLATFSARHPAQLAGRVGAFINPAVFGAGLTVAQAISAWQGLVSRSLTVRRVYFGTIPASITPDLTADAQAGRLVCMSFNPSHNPPSQADADAFGTFLASCKAAGLTAKVSLYAEAVTLGLTAAQVIPATRFYAPTIRQYYPLVFCTGSYGVQHRDENSYYAGDAYIDEVATDYYCHAYVSGETLDLAASVADNAGAPAAAGPVFGMDAQARWPAVETALGVSSMAAWRAYNRGMPASYPGDDAPIPAGVTTPIVSYKPSLPISAADKADLAALFAAAPAGSLNTIWHEGERAGYTPEQLRAAHALAHDIFRAHAPAGAWYGQISMTYTAYAGSAHYPLSQWIATRSDGGPLDFYGADWYPSTNGDASATTSISAWLAQLQSVIPDPVIAITETNYSTGSGITWSQAQDLWFSQARAWAAANKAITFLPYFDDAHGLPWPPSAAVIAQLAAIAAASSPRLSPASAKPFGVWEMNNSTASQTQAHATAYYNYLLSFFTARLLAGKANGDLMFFNSAGSSQNAPITTSSDFRVPLFQALFDGLSAVPPGP